MKPILCVDFDGVLHSYTSGWKGADVVSDPPVPGAIRWLAEATKHFKVAIYSSRSKEPGGIAAMCQWLGQYSVDPEHGMPDDFDHGTWGEIDFPTQKPAAFLTIDDRAVCFTGQWPAFADLLSFKPWNKR